MAMKNEVNGPLTITIGAIGVIIMATATVAV